MLNKLRNFFEKYIQGPFRTSSVVGPKCKRSRSGQVAIVIMLVIAIAFIFYAAVLNFGVISESKMFATIGSNVGAARLASQMASYGQNLVMTYLGGQLEKCDWTTLLVIAIIASLFVPFYMVAAMLALNSLLSEIGGAFGVTAQIIGSIILGPLIGAIIILQTEVIDAGLTRKWNSQKEALSVVDDFVEGSLAMGLQQVVTDEAKVPDLHDFDNDAVWGYGRDQISRYTFYYDRFLNATAGKQAAYLAGFSAVTTFVNGLKELLYQGGDSWGITDPWRDACPTHECCYNPLSPTVIPSVCNPCCQPSVLIDPFSQKPLTGESPRPFCCDIGPGQCGVSTTCDAMTVYTGYPYTYDPTHQNYRNTFQSYLEKLGFDDEHYYFYKDSVNPLGPQIPELPGGQSFKLEDTTGFYPADPARGIFPYLHRLAWGIDLTKLNQPTEPEDCYWFDISYETNCQGVAMPAPLTGLGLPIPPYSLFFNVSPRVDSVDQNTPGNPPVAVDKVKLPENVIADPNECAERAFSSATIGFWKSGADRYCRNDWPYFGPCAKNLPGTCSTADRTCMCGEGGTDPTKFREDIVDGIVYGLKQFVPVAEEVIKSYELNPAGTSAGLKVWYPDIAEWVGSSGALGLWANELSGMSTRIRALFTTSFSGSCTEVWCVPNSACPGMPPREAATIDSNGNGIRGDIFDVIACLNYNIEGESASGGINPVGTNRGNDYRFRQCAQTCSAVNCRRLPRSLVPGFTPNTTYVPGPLVNEADIALMLACTDECSVANCTLMPVTRASGGAYTWPLGPPSGFVVDNCRLWGPNNDWYDAIVANLRTAGPSCDLTNPTGWLYNVRRSEREATNQVPKFRHRRQYLLDRITDANRVISVFDEGASRFRSFVSGPAAALASAARRDPPAFVPYHLIYGWQSKPPADAPAGTPGKWHVAKVEARTPGRCDNACGAGAPGSAPPNRADPPFPKIRTETTHWGLRRCYYLENFAGVVKFRAIRFDEIRPNFTIVRFPNNLTIWNFREFYPGVRTAITPANLGVACSSEVIPDPPAPPLPGGVSNVYSGAFIMWERTPGNTTCWNRVHQLLTAGVVTETCARYDYMGNGMGFAFIPCSPF